MFTRRAALKTVAAVTGSMASGQFADQAQTPGATASTTQAAHVSEPTGPFKLAPLPYKYDALEPFIDSETMRLHHDKHHAAYVKKLNDAVAGLDFSRTPDIDTMLKNLDAIPENIRTAVRNQGGGHSNHSLLWKTLEPASRPATGINAPKGNFAQAMGDDLGGLDKFKKDAMEGGMGLFGSGWVWLVLDGGKHLTLLTLPNQDSPFMEGHYPLFGIDVWEHAYYLKYRNVRADYLAAIWNVVNWDFVSDRYDQAMMT